MTGARRPAHDEVEPLAPRGDPSVPSLCGDCLSSEALRGLREGRAWIVTARPARSRCVMCGRRIAPGNDEAPPPVTR